MPDRAQSSDDIEDRDPGLARERTDLAWTRTAISYAALGAVMLHTSAIGLVVVATGVGVWGLGQLSARQAHPAARRRLSNRRTVQLITAVTTLMSLLALALALLAPDTGIIRPVNPAAGSWPSPASPSTGSRGSLTSVPRSSTSWSSPGLALLAADEGINAESLPSASGKPARKRATPILTRPRNLRLGPVRRRD